VQELTLLKSTNEEGGLNEKGPAKGTKKLEWIPGGETVGERAEIAVNVFG
jgi:hypothetical protein